MSKGASETQTLGWPMQIVVMLQRRKTALEHIPQNIPRTQDWGMRRHMPHNNVSPQFMEVFRFTAVSSKTPDKLPTDAGLH